MRRAKGEPGSTRSGYDMVEDQVESTSEPLLPCHLTDKRGEGDLTLAGREDGDTGRGRDRVPDRQSLECGPSLPSSHRSRPPPAATKSLRHSEDPGWRTVTVSYRQTCC